MNALVTGASSGFGKEISICLSKKGYHVYGTSRTPSKVDLSEDITLLELDLLSDDSIKSLSQHFEENNISLDLIVQNAGFASFGSIEETDQDLMELQLQTNFIGTVKLTKALLPGMRKAKKGKIVFITSLAGLIGVPYQGFYSASKHALEGFAKSLRFELLEFNIYVSCIEPGFHKTDLHENIKTSSNTIKDYSRSRSNTYDEIFNSLKNAPPPSRITIALRKIVKSNNPRFTYKLGMKVKFLSLIAVINYKLFEYGVKRKFGLKRN